MLLDDQRKPVFDGVFSPDADLLGHLVPVFAHRYEQFDDLQVLGGEPGPSFDFALEVASPVLAALLARAVGSARA
jgi:hypothetical protein